MKYEAAQPRYTLPFAGQEYELLGTFAVIEAAEFALKEHILHIPGKCVQLPVSELAKLLSAILSACGHQATYQTVADDILNKVGIGSEEYAMLGVHLYAFLSITIAPPKEREAVAERMGEMFGKMTSGSASSPTTDASV